MKQEISIFTFTAFVVAFFLLCKFIYQGFLFFVQPYFSPLRVLPGPPSKHWYYGWITKNVRSVSSKAILENHKEFGRAFYGLAPHRDPTLYIIDEEAVNFIFQNQYGRNKIELFDRMAITSSSFSSIFGSTLLGVSSDIHKRQRRAFSPAFNDQSIRQSSPLMYEVATKLVDVIRNEIQMQGEEWGQVETLGLMKETAIDMIGKVAFGEDFGGLKKQTTKLFTYFQFLSNFVFSPTSYTLLRFRFPFVVQFTKYFVNEEKELKSKKDGIERRANELIAKAEKYLKEQSETDLRTVFQMVKHSSSMQITDEELRGSVPTLIFAGYETTATTMTWALYHLIHSRTDLDRQAILRSELQDKENQAWRFDYAVLNRLPYLEAVCTEILRLNPAAATLARVCMQDTVIPLGTPIILRDGVTKTNKIPIKKGDKVSVSLEGVNRLESLWGKDAKSFMPERWLKKGHPLFDPELSQMTEQARKLGGWNHIMTFGQGVRMCLGFRFALAEMKIVLAHCIDQFEWKEVIHPKTGEPLVIEIRRKFFPMPAVKGTAQYQLPMSAKAL